MVSTTDCGSVRTGSNPVSHPTLRRAKTSLSKTAERFSLAQGVVSKRAVVCFRRVRRTTTINSMWHVYIIRCSDDSLYTGVTTDVSRRVKAHNEKSGGSYTRIRTPVKLVYKESHPTQSSALKREAQIKKWSRAKKLARIKGNIEALSNLAKSRD